MAWSRLEPGFSRHPKRIKSGPIASWLWACGVDHCTEFHTDGFVDEAAIAGFCPAIRGATLRKAVADLVAVGSWDRLPGGYQVHGYLDHNPTAKQVEADRQASRERYQRFKDRQRGNADTNALATEQSNGVAATPTVSRSVGRSAIRPQKKGFQGNGRVRDSAEAVQGWESVMAAVKVREPQPTFRDPHVAKVLGVMGGIGQFSHYNNRDVHAGEVNSGRRRFLDLYDSVGKDDDGHLA